MSEDETKRCGKCGETKPAGAFHKNSIRPDGLHRMCKACRSEYDKRSHAGDVAYGMRHRTWRARNPRRTRDYSLKRFGLPLGGFDVMRADQGGACAICGTIPEASLQVDHDHATGVLRALLCGSCNRGLGHFKDDPALMLRAVAYLRAHREQPRLAIPARVGT